MSRLFGRMTSGGGDVVIREAKRACRFQRLDMTSEMPCFSDQYCGLGGVNLIKGQRVFFILFSTATSAKDWIKLFGGSPDVS